MLSAVLGGALIGLAAVVMLVGLGQIAGVSGVLGSSLRAGGAASWRVAFLAGMIAVGLVTRFVSPGSLVSADGRSTWIIAVGGLLVGLGTRIGNGCTSGHGVCGIGRGSRRSLVATMVFMATSAATVAVYGFVHGGAS